jgi:hypothetical protein
LGNIIDYEKAKEGFAILIKLTVSAEHADDMIYHLEKYLTEPISNQSYLLLLTGSIEKNRRHFCIAIRDLMKYYERSVYG